jgi:hypothetical protein
MPVAPPNGFAFSFLSYFDQIKYGHGALGTTSYLPVPPGYTNAWKAGRQFTGCNLRI